MQRVLKFELHELIAKKPKMFERMIERQADQLGMATGEFNGEAEGLGKEIEELAGRVAPGRQ